MAKRPDAKEWALNSMGDLSMYTQSHRLEREKIKQYGFIRNCGIISQIRMMDALDPKAFKGVIPFRKKKRR